VTPCSLVTIYLSSGERYSNHLQSGMISQKKGVARFSETFYISTKMDGVTTQRAVTIRVNKILSPKSSLWITPHGAGLHSTRQWVENLLRNGRQALV